MNKIIRYVQTYLVFASPFVAACILWQIIQPDYGSHLNALSHALMEMLSLNLITWFAVLIVFLTSLVFIPSVRENTLRRLANLKERDEREEYITGKASRASYISTLSLIIFFLFFSMFTFTLSPSQEAGKKYALGISFGYSPFNESKTEIAKQPAIFSSKDYSLSTTSILFIILGWQLVMFNVAARKEKS